MALNKKDLSKLKQEIMLYNPAAKFDYFDKAFDLVKTQLKGKKHPLLNKEVDSLILETASALSDMKVDYVTLITAILNPLNKYGSVSLDEIEKNFGKEISELLNKLIRFKESESLQGTKEDTSIILHAMAKDPRLILIRLANMLIYSRNIDSVKESEKNKITEKILDSFAPIAHKLGMNKLKSELEDRCFAQLNPIEYNEIKKKMESLKGIQDADSLIKRIESVLRQAKIKAEVTGRPKHIYSIYSKMQKKNKSFEELFDLIGVRVITETEKECYEILGLIHSIWKPITGEFNDYIAKPKANMYQSLHTKVIGPEKRVFEVQIRTKEMHKVAEYGYAVHWKYKGHKESKIDSKMSWLKQVNDWRQDLRKSTDLMDSLETEFIDNEISVFTPKRQVIELPSGATALDFAYAIHSDIGHKCSKAKVNGKIVALNHELDSGDLVEIITSETQIPKRSWLSMVKTGKAKQKIRQKLQIQAQHKKIDNRKKGMQKISIKSPNDEEVKLARCCTPIPGDNVTGYKTTKRKIVVHRIDCINAEKLANTNRLVNVEWNVKGKGKFLVEFKKDSSNDKPGMLSDLLQIFSNKNIKIKSIDARVLDSKKTRGLFTIETKDLVNLEKLMNELSQINWITNVERN